MAPKKNDKAKPKESKDAKSSSSKGSKSTDAEDSGSKSKLKPANSINTRHILCEKHSKKEEALTALQNGKAFDEVAREFSEDKARQGGSLGWKTRGSLLKAFEDVAYGLEVSTTKSPKWGEAKTSEGYHIIMVEGRKMLFLLGRRARIVYSSLAAENNVTNNGSQASTE